MAKRSSSKSTSASGGSRSRTRDRRRQRQQQKQQQRTIGIVVGVVIVAIVLAVAFIIVNQPASAPIPEGTLDKYDGIPQTVSDEGFPILGNPNAPVLVEEFSSFSCPGCQQFHENFGDDIVEQVREGVIAFEYIPLTTGSIPNAVGASKAALCAGEQGAFFEYHDALFDWHSRYGNQAFSQNRITSGVENLGLNEGQFDSCIGSSRIDDVMSAAQSVAAGRGATSTPSVFVNGTALPTSADLVSAIQQALAATGLSPVPLDSGDDEPEPVVEETDEPEMTEEAEAAESADEDMDETPEATSEAESEAASDEDDDSFDTEATEEADS